MKRNGGVRLLRNVQLEKAKIKWKEGEAYDDWDNIAESLYKNIVCSSLTGAVTSSNSIAKYNFNYDHYCSINFIEVRSKDPFINKLVFVSFETNLYPLDNVKVAEVDKDDKVISYTNLRYDGLKFVFVKNTNGKKEYIETIEVKL